MGYSFHTVREYCALSQSPRGSVLIRRARAQQPRTFYTMHKLGSLSGGCLSHFVFRHIRTAHLITIAYTLLLVFCLWPSRFATHYAYIPEAKLYDALVPNVTPNISGQAATMGSCSYLDLLYDNPFEFTALMRTTLQNAAEIRAGGEWQPDDCVPKFSTAILVIYRQRERQLNEFLIYMHNFLRKQRIHYRIFIVEQFDQKPFNRAKLFNIGYVYARRLGFPCVVLHDVDLLPMNLGQLYACTQQPRHMCASLDTFRFTLPYAELFGGVVAIESQVYADINGMSNMFHGWGGEDDDLFGRLYAKHIDICRFPPTHSQYAMMLHHKEVPNADRLMYLKTGPLRYHTDGLNSLVFNEKEYRLHNLFTHVLVET